MSNWIVYAVGFSQIVVLHFLAMPYCLRMTYSMYMGRNRQWVADNATFRERYPLPKLSVWLSFLLGIAWLVYFASEVLKDSDNEKSLQLNLLNWPVVSFSLLYVSHAIVECFRVRRKIPLPTKRSVILERRSLEAVINPRWVHTACILVALVIVAYVAAHYAGRIDARVFVKRMATIAVFSSAVILPLVVGIRRKKQPLDDMWGPGYRKGEIVFWVACLYLIAVTGALSFLQDIFATTLLTYIGGQTAFSVLIQAGLFYLGRHSWPKSPEPPGGSLSSVLS